MDPCNPLVIVSSSLLQRVRQGNCIYTSGDAKGSRSETHPFISEGKGAPFPFVPQHKGMHLDAVIVSYNAES